ncbi:hypothetical protein ACXC9Q_26275 (plasmid) [Kribbella sp. CWNU-51]
MPGPTTDARIYLLDADERQVSPGGPAVVGPDGTREEMPLAAYRAVRHVLEAMRAGRAVKIVPLRAELPIDEAAEAIAIGRDDLRKYVAEGAVPFRSTEYVDWVRLADVIQWDKERRRNRRAVLDELMGDDPDDEQPS